MKILSLDSSAVVASVALTEDEELLAEYTLNNGNTHSETLLPMVEAAMSALGLTVADVDLFAASSGPGSFTGVRI
ncbi:MAG: tRNA (adenosine(37)-N6)-threonylcarbamoyltransferase complex dimerization subunit type 1 TsaB, partial [Clostridia bacterium]|nr:tRNA (adenosine(37)-N6)-threonylcarbamoyltransferase complex dimerization subunit type 1 TsaB [Clostridia bacterium]